MTSRTTTTAATSTSRLARPATSGRRLRPGRPLHREAGGCGGPPRRLATESSVFKIDGFRIDTACCTSNKASSPSGSPRSWRRREAAGVSNFQFFGEVRLVRTRSTCRTTALGCRGLPTSTSRCRTGSRLRERAIGPEGDRAAARTTTTTSSAAAWSRRCRGSSATTTWPGGAARSAPRRAHRSHRERAAQARPARARQCSSSAGAPVVYYGDEVGTRARAATRRHARRSPRRRSAEWKTQDPRRPRRPSARFVASRSRSTRSRSGYAARAPARRHPSALHRRIVRPLRPGQGARRQPYRCQRPA